jgi:hypothetical protein
MSEPGWRPNPDGSPTLRWWDGHRWTDETLSRIRAGTRMRLSKRTQWGIFLTIIALAGGAGLINGLHSRHHAKTPAFPYFTGPADGSSPAPETHNITYYLVGSATSADLTLQLNRSSPTRQSSATIPLVNSTGTRGLTFTAEPGSLLYISAAADTPGTLTCRIVDNGQVVDRVTATGPSATVTCQGTA